MFGLLGAVSTLAALLAASCADPASGPGRLLVTSGFTDQIFVIDPVDGHVRDSLSLDRRPGERDEPHAVAAAADGLHWYATLSHGEPSLWKYESEGDRLVGRVTLNAFGASRVRLGPGDSIAAVPDYWLAGGGRTSRVTFVRTRDLAVIAAPEVCAAPHDAVFSPDGTRIAVTCPLEHRVVLLDGSTFQEVDRFDVGDRSRPMNAAWAPEGGALYVSLMQAGAVLRIRPGRESTRRLPAAAGPAQLAISPDGAWLVVAHRVAGTIGIHGLATASYIEVESPGAHPHGVAFDSGSGVAYVTWEGDTESLGGVAAIGLPNGELRWSTEVGSFTLGVAWVRGR